MHTTHPVRWRPGRTLPLLLLLAGVGCGGGGGQDAQAPTNVRLTGGITAGQSVTGTVTLEATAEDDSGKIARMEFYVSDTLACVDGLARSSGATFSCTWNTALVPPGAYALTARAYDAADNLTRSEPIAFTVPQPNRAPTLQRVTASSININEGSSVSLSVEASDEDAHPLTYAWAQAPSTPMGTFGTETGAQRTWTAPLVSRDTPFTLRVTASDNNGGSVQGSVVVTVLNVAALNQPPSVDESITPPTTRVIAGDTVSLFIGARDRDGDPLTYSWKTVPEGAGIFTTADASLAQWRSGDLGAATPFTFRVTVSDGTVSVTRTLELRVELPQYSRDIQPMWTPACTDCHNATVGTAGDLNLLPESAYASLVGRDGYGACGSLARVRPGNPDESLLVQRISNADCGTRMPLRDTDYFERNPGELTRIRSWILSGAPNN